MLNGWDIDSFAFGIIALLSLYLSHLIVDKKKLLDKYIKRHRLDPMDSWPAQQKKYRYFLLVTFSLFIIGVLIYFALTGWFIER